MENTYDPKKVQLVIAGMTVTGYAPGDKINVEPTTAEDVKSFAGIDGDVTFAEVHDDRHTITINLSNNSPSHKMISALKKTRQAFPVAITNTSGGKYLGGGTGSRISSKPSRKFGADFPVTEWKIIVPDYTDADLPE